MKKQGHESATLGYMICIAVKAKQSSVQQSPTPEPMHLTS